MISTRWAGGLGDVRTQAPMVSVPLARLGMDDQLQYFDQIVQGANAKVDQVADSSNDNIIGTTGMQNDVGQAQGEMPTDNAEAEPVDTELVSNMNGPDVDIGMDAEENGGEQELPPEPQPPQQGWLRRNWGWVAAGGAVLLAGTIAAVVIVRRRRAGR